MGRDFGPTFGGEGSKPEFRFDAVSDANCSGGDKSSLGMIRLATGGHMLGRGQEQHQVRWAGAENGHHFSVTEPFGSSLASSSSVFSTADSLRKHVRNADSWAPHLLGTPSQPARSGAGDLHCASQTILVRGSEERL